MDLSTVVQLKEFMQLKKRPKIVEFDSSRGNQGVDVGQPGQLAASTSHQPASPAHIRTNNFLRKVVKKLGCGS